MHGQDKRKRAKRRDTECAEKGQDETFWECGLVMGDSLLVGGGEFAELGNCGGDYVQGEIDVCGSGVAAEAEAQAGAGFFRRQINGGQDVRWLDGARGTGSTSGTSEPLQVESNKEGFAFDAGEDKVGGVRSARSSAAVHARLGNAAQQTLLQLVAKSGNTPGVLGE